MHGVTVNTHTPVIDVNPVRGAVTLEDGPTQRADRVVAVAGPWVRDLVPSATGRVKPSRQVVAYLTPPERLETPGHRHRWSWTSTVRRYLRGAAGRRLRPQSGGLQLQPQGSPWTRLSGVSGRGRSTLRGRRAPRRTGRVHARAAQDLLLHGSEARSLHRRHRRPAPC